ncbi:MAG: hypothetical protein Q7U68_01000 [Candidatus Roizmanbacteria bacterium]|nr:hypothetical protein [Candidatus Roizmanbacteria bacterium]
MFFIVFLLLLLIFYFVGKKEVSLSLKQSIFIGILIRLAITFIFLKSSSEDLTSFLDAGAIILAKKPIYPSLYFPFFPYLGALAVFLKSFFPPLIFLKFVFTFFDLGNLYLVYLLSKKNLSQTLLYAVNPITIICSNIHGQFDVIPLFFLLLAIYLFNKHKEISSMTAISFAIFTKTWPALFIIPLLRRLKNKFLFALIFLIPIISILFHSWFFKTPILEIITPIKNYRGVYGYWGIGNILILLWPKIDASIIQFLRRIFFIALFIFSFYPNNKNIIKNILIIMLFFFVFTLTFGSQWLAWLVPFIILVRPKNWEVFFVSASLYLLVAFTRNVYLLPANITAIFDVLGTVLGFAAWLSTISLLKTSLSN